MLEDLVALPTPQTQAWHTHDKHARTQTGHVHNKQQRRSAFLSPHCAGTDIARRSSVKEATVKLSTLTGDLRS